MTDLEAAAALAKAIHAVKPEIVNGAQVTASRVLGVLRANGWTLLPAPATPAEPGFDVAWAAAEAVLPEGWAIGMLWGTVTSERWGASAGPWPSKQGDNHEFGGGDTPAAALRQLAGRLDERDRVTGELTLDQLRARALAESPREDR